MITEWEVVGVIVVLVGLALSVVKPIVSLNSSITRLNELVSFLEKDLSALTERNSESHARLWRHEEEQDAMLQTHETRLTVLEKQ